MLLVTNGLSFTKAKDISARLKLCLSAILKYSSVASKHFSLLKRARFENNFNLLSSGILPFLYLPDNTPKPNGEYAKSPTFSLLQISALPTSNNLFKRE